MPAFAAAMAIAAPLALGGAMPVSDDEKSLFHIPSEDDFRLQRIARAENEREWPFTVDEGYLTCAYVVGRPAVYFTEMPVGTDFDRAELRTVIVSTDPFDLAFGNLGGGGLVTNNGSIADLIRQMAPFESLGSRLCEQPRGTEVGPGEL
jgi:hypothetical protein